MKAVVNYGFTFYFVIGKWNTPKIQIMDTTRGLRICLGFLSIKIGFYDLESWERKILSAFIKADDKTKTKMNDIIKSIDDIADTVHVLAWKKGWHSIDEVEDDFIERTCNNLHDEISELHEAWRNNILHKPCDKSERMIELGIKPLTCAEEELADVVIRALDSSKKLGIDIESAILRKHEYNKHRPFRHGGKRS